MPTYFFHTDNGKRVTDQVGTELPDDARAHRMAIKLAGAMMHDDPQLLWGGRAFSTEVALESGEPLFTIIAQALPGVPPERA